MDGEGASRTLLPTQQQQQTFPASCPVGAPAGVEPTPPAEGRHARGRATDGGALARRARAVLPRRGADANAELTDAHQLTNLEKLTCKVMDAGAGREQGDGRGHRPEGKGFGRECEVTSPCDDQVP